jgi:hypothetical protein
MTLNEIEEILTICEINDICQILTKKFIFHFLRLVMKIICLFVHHPIYRKADFGLSLDYYFLPNEFRNIFNCSSIVKIESLLKLFELIIRQDNLEQFI